MSWCRNMIARTCAVWPKRPCRNLVNGVLQKTKRTSHTITRINQSRSVTRCRVISKCSPNINGNSVLWAPAKAGRLARVGSHLLQRINQALHQVQQECHEATFQPGLHSEEIFATQPSWEQAIEGSLTPLGRSCYVGAPSHETTSPFPTRHANMLP